MNNILFYFIYVIIYFLLSIYALCTVTMEFTGKVPKVFRHFKVCAKLHPLYFMLTEIDHTVCDLLNTSFCSTHI